VQVCGVIPLIERFAQLFRQERVAHFTSLLQEREMKHLKIAPEKTRHEQERESAPDDESGATRREFLANLRTAATVTAASGAPTTPI
jgi:hypothetical protein